MNACRVCGKPCVKILDLGRVHIANALRKPGEPKGPKYPLALMLCEACTLVQLVDTLPPEILFGDYRYASSTSTTMVAHASELARRLTREENLTPTSLVLEVGSNDGYLLQHYAAVPEALRDKVLSPPLPRETIGCRVLGVEPAERLATMARHRGIATRGDFFSYDLAVSLQEQVGKADIVHAHNVLAHVPDLIDIVRGFKEMLAPKGLLVVEVPYVVDMVRDGSFDTAYHEHVYYFSLTALRSVFRRCGLDVVDVQHVALHGGTLQIHARHSSLETGRSRSLREISQAEIDDGINVSRYYDRLHRSLMDTVAELLARLSHFHASGMRVAAYGASAKGTTLLDAVQIDETMIDFVVDKNPAKQGLRLPGLDLPILPPSALLENQPAVTLLLTWNFQKEILEEQTEYIRRGGRFLLPRHSSFHAPSHPGLI